MLKDYTRGIALMMMMAYFISFLFVFFFYVSRLHEHIVISRRYRRGISSGTRMKMAQSHGYVMNFLTNKAVQGKSRSLRDLVCTTYLTTTLQPYFTCTCMYVLENKVRWPPACRLEQEARRFAGSLSTQTLMTKDEGQ